MASFHVFRDSTRNYWVGLWTSTSILHSGSLLKGLDYELPLITVLQVLKCMATNLVLIIDLTIAREPTTRFCLQFKESIWTNLKHVLGTFFFFPRPNFRHILCSITLQQPQLEIRGYKCTPKHSFLIVSVLDLCTKVKFVKYFSVLHVNARFTKWENSFEANLIFKTGTGFWRGGKTRHFNKPNKGSFKFLNSTAAWGKEYMEWSRSIFGLRRGLSSENWKSFFPSEIGAIRLSSGWPSR